MGLIETFKNYTKRNKNRVDSLKNKVNSYKDSCKKIPSGKEVIAIRNNGKIINTTVENFAFLEKTNEFRKRLRNGESITSIMPEALAVCREATYRTLGMFQYDVQIEAAIAMIGDIVETKDINGSQEEIHERVIAEMKTGEGKTLVQILVAYLNALEATKYEDKSKWKSVHVMTSNDALAKRDANNNRKVFELLGLSCGFVKGRQGNKAKSDEEKKKAKLDKQNAYSCDIVYATATTIAFDYLEDNFIVEKEDINISKPFGFAIVDEADDLLIDQASNPLKMSGKLKGLDEELAQRILDHRSKTLLAYKWAAEFLNGKQGVRKSPLTCTVFDQKYRIKNIDFDYEYDTDYGYIKDKQEVIFSQKLEEEIGRDKLDEETFNLRYIALENCIKAIHSYRRGEAYELEVSGNIGKVVLIDQNTGRKRRSNRYNDGMQEAIEALEQYRENDRPNSLKRFNIQQSKSNSTLARCTYPDFLSLYEGNVCGMTGTSDQEEFYDLYGFGTYEVPTRKPVIRKDETNELYATSKQKYSAIMREIIISNKIGQPVLIGTTSVSESMLLANMLFNYANLCKIKMPFQVLNANNEEEENKIIEGAGQRGAITIATNMAGRGTDIKLGPGVDKLGGLYVIGTTRNKSKRIDMQLRGRSGRQGDPGKTKYFSSLDDEIIRQHYNGEVVDEVKNLVSREDGLIENKSIIRFAEKALETKEQIDKSNRKNSEMFGKTFTQQKRVIYENRKNIFNLTKESFQKIVTNIIERYVDILVSNYSFEEIENLIGHVIDATSCYSKDKKTLENNLISSLTKKYQMLFNSLSEEQKDSYVKDERKKMLNILDIYWTEQLDVLEDLKSMVSVTPGIDTMKEYETKANEAFYKGLIPCVYNEILTYLFNPSLKMGDYIINQGQPTSENDRKLI